MKSLSESETSTAIQARIEGLQEAQIPAINRLRALGIPDDMIYAAALATNTCDLGARKEDYESAEAAIIAWGCKEWTQSEAGVLLILNGEAQPVGDC